MIDWWWVFTNALWIIGAAGLLAALSYASWEASWMEATWRERLARPGYQMVIHLALLLISVGAGANEARQWLQLAWFALALAFGVLAVLDWRMARQAEVDPE